ncbi:lysozyme inhibitor LprI family protein [Massilia sp. METH4]|uniref:lysozyme inhibitor LprI family protein n=1 Tax=Massilia sp. METH4 TaxID=3123041 RepID=UPI0030CB8BF8
MRLNTWSALGLWLILFSAHSADQQNIAPVEEILDTCSYSSQAGMRDCLEDSVRDSSTAVNAAEKKFAATMSRWDERQKYIAAAHMQFNISKRAFLKYRDEQCALAAALGGGAIGNALELRRLACIYELNRERSNQLTRFSSSLYLK